MPEVSTEYCSTAMPKRDQAPAMGSNFGEIGPLVGITGVASRMGNFGKIGPSVAELWASASAVGIMGVASRIGVEVGLLIGGRNEPWRWRGRSADGTTSRGGVRPQQLFYKYIEASRHAIPWPFTLAPTRSPVDCDVVGRWHQAEQSKSSARCQNGAVTYPPECLK